MFIITSFELVINALQLGRKLSHENKIVYAICQDIDRPAKLKLGILF